MNKKTQKAPLDALRNYLPEGLFTSVSRYLQYYKVRLTITRSRRTLLGDYRRPFQGEGHRITVNGDLNKYAFLVTLLHELAHLLAFEKYGGKIAPHGEEWKSSFKKIVGEVDLYKFLPADVASAMRRYMMNPAARSCSDDNLTKTLRKYDLKKKSVLLVEDLQEGEAFLIKGGEQFRRGRKLRKRYECRNVKTGQLYIFSPLYEVSKVEDLP